MPCIDTGAAESLARAEVQDTEVVLAAVHKPWPGPERIDHSTPNRVQLEASHVRLYVENIHKVLGPVV